MLSVFWFSSCKVNKTAADHSGEEGWLCFVPTQCFIQQVWKVKEGDILFVSNGTRHELRLEWADKKKKPVLKMTWSTGGWTLNCRYVLTSREPLPLDTSTPHMTGCSLWKTQNHVSTNHLQTLQLNFVSKGGQREQNDHESKYFLLLVEMADQCRLDLQLEFMLLIIRVCFVVLQTWSVGDEVILFDYKSTFWMYFESLLGRKEKVFTVWEEIVGRMEDQERWYMSKGVPAGGAVFGVGSLAHVHQPLCSGSNTAD